VEVQVASKNIVKRILLEKTCSIDSVTDLTNQIFEALTTSNRIEFDLSGVSELELPVIQVLYAAAQTAGSAGGSINLVGVIRESVATRLQVSGFSKTLAKDGPALQSGLRGFGGVGVST
jgi:anti-anti-sigma regulatory factor